MALPALLANYVNYGDGSTTGYYAVTAWATGAVKAAGALIRQLTPPAVGSERVFVCTTAGTTHATTEPVWVNTRGAVQPSDNGVIWQECTGQPAVNGDATNTIRWSVVKNTVVSLGVIIKDVSNNIFICTTSGTAGNGAEPTWNTTAGQTTADNTVTWTCIGTYSGKWTAPHARLANAFAANWGAAGDDFFFASTSAETRITAVTLTSPGTAALLCRVLCVNPAGSVPPVSADLSTAGAFTTTTSGVATIQFQGFAKCYGISFTSIGSTSAALGFGTASASATWWRLENCKLILSNNIAGARISFGTLNTAAKDQLYELINTTVQFAHASQGIVVQAPLVWTSTPSAVVLGTAPTTLFQPAIGNSGSSTLIGVDLNNLGSGKNLVDMSIAVPNSHYFQDCKLGASVVIGTGSVAGQGGTTVTLVNCDSGNTNYRYYKQTYQGTEQHQSTIVRTGGATDGTTPVSRQMVSTANPQFYSPMVSEWVFYWNNTASGTATITIPIISFTAALLTNREVWLEIESQTTSGFPLGVFKNNAAADVLAVAANQPTDTSTWTGTARANSTAYALNDIISVQGKLWICTTAGTSAGSEPAGYTGAADGASVTDGAAAVFRSGFRQSIAVTTGTLQLKGPIYARVMLAKASTTVYFDPLIQAT